MRLFFYADESDIQQLIEEFYEVQNITFYKSTWLEGDESFKFVEASALIQETKYTDKPRMYLACNKETNLVSKPLKLKSGQIQFQINHGLMPDTIRVLFGQPDNENKVLQSTIDGFCETKLSKSLFKTFKKIVVANSTKVGDIYVLAGAKQKYTDGWVLTPNKEAGKGLHLSM